MRPHRRAAVGESPVRHFSAQGRSQKSGRMGEARLPLADAMWPERCRAVKGRLNRRSRLV